MFLYVFLLQNFSKVINKNKVKSALVFGVYHATLRLHLMTKFPALRRAENALPSRSHGRGRSCFSFSRMFNVHTRSSPHKHKKNSLSEAKSRQRRAGWRSPGGRETDD